MTAGIKTTPKVGKLRKYKSGLTEYMGFRVGQWVTTPLGKRAQIIGFVGIGIWNHKPMRAICQYEGTKSHKGQVILMLEKIKTF
jgi:hypothetical protein